MERLVLRKLKLEDAAKLSSLLSDKKVLEDIGISTDTSENGEKVWIKEHLNDYKKKNPKDYHLGIEVGNNLIGVIGMNKIDYQNEKMTLGYWIGRPYWGNGYMTNALKIFIKDIKKRFNPTRIQAVVYSYNLGSQRVLEKNGFKFEGEKKKSIKRKNKFINEKIYALVK